MFEPPTLELAWQDLAACREFSVESFYPPTDQDGDEAKLICFTCAVREQCLEFALAAGERFGIWGGMTPQERRYLIARRRRASQFPGESEEEATLTVS